MNPNFGRRAFLRSILPRVSALWMAGCSLFVVRPAFAGEWNHAAFDARNIDEALAKIGATEVLTSDLVVLKAPEIAENGAIVPIEIESKVPGTRLIHILVDKNIQPLVATFDFAEDAVPFVATRIKMSESSMVRVIVYAGGKYHASFREVKVTIGGCAG